MNICATGAPARKPSATAEARSSSRSGSTTSQTSPFSCASAADTIRPESATSLANWAPANRATARSDPYPNSGPDARRWPRTGRGEWRRPHHIPKQGSSPLPPPLRPLPPRWAWSVAAAPKQYPPPPSCGAGHPPLPGNEGRQRGRGRRPRKNPRLVPISPAPAARNAHSRRKPAGGLSTLGGNGILAKGAIQPQPPHRSPVFGLKPHTSIG